MPEGTKWCKLQFNRSVSAGGTQTSFIAPSVVQPIVAERHENRTGNERMPSWWLRCRDQHHCFVPEARALGSDTAPIASFIARPTQCGRLHSFSLFVE